MTRYVLATATVWNLKRRDYPSVMVCKCACVVTCTRHHLRSAGVIVFIAIVASQLANAINHGDITKTNHIMHPYLIPHEIPV